MIIKMKTNKQSIDKSLWLNLLYKEGIEADSYIDETYGLFENDDLIATASRYKNVIKCVAIDSDYQGGSYFNELISHIIEKNVENNYFKHYVYTKPESKKSFEYLGFEILEEVPGKLVFMEKAVSGFVDYLLDLDQYKTNDVNNAAIVMNANPFTLGHLYLITTASLENDHVFLFILSEDMSVFNTETRMFLVREGTRHLSNLTIIPTDNYMISSATFPSYFLKGDDEVIRTQATLDARLFANKIAPRLNIKRRYVGNEPFSHTTNLYNQTLADVFKNKMELVVVERTSINNEVISATKIRNAMAQDNVESIKDLVPSTTYRFISGHEGKIIAQKLKEGKKHE